MVRQATYHALALELAAERGRREALERQVATHDTLVRFLCGRINHMEAERQAYIRKLAGVEIPSAMMVLPIDATPKAGRAPGPMSAAEMLSGLDGAALFEDVGDEAAEKLGIGWNREGRVVYKETPAPAAESDR